MDPNKSSYRRPDEDLKIIARLTEGEGTDAYISAMISDKQIARDSYFIRFVKTAMKYVFCTRMQSHNYYERWMNKRLPQIQKGWQKFSDELRPAVLGGSQQITQVVGENKRGNLIKIPKCGFFQRQGEEVYLDHEKIERICMVKCGQFRRDRQNDTTLCPYSRRNIPDIYFGTGELILRDDELDGMVIKDPQRYMKENADKYIQLCKDRKNILRTPWYTNFNRIEDIQEFRTTNPVGVLAYNKIQLPLIDIMKSLIELKRGCKNYGRHIQPLTHDIEYKCTQLAEITDYNDMLDFCMECEMYEITKNGKIKCPKFYSSLGYM